MSYIINLMGGPGAGKSTLAAGLFAKMKHRGIKCELVTEYAKDLVYSDRVSHLQSNQLYVLAKQYDRVRKLFGKVDFIITDSPLVMQKAYGTDLFYYEEVCKLIDKINEHYYENNINVFVARKDKYMSYGRLQTEEEAKELDKDILKLVEESNSSKHDLIKLVNTGEQNVAELLSILISKGFVESLSEDPSLDDSADLNHKDIKEMIKSGSIFNFFSRKNKSGQ